MAKHNKKSDADFSSEDFTDEFEDISFGSIDEIAMPSVEDKTKGKSAKELFAAKQTESAKEEPTEEEKETPVQEPEEKITEESEAKAEPVDGISDDGEATKEFSAVKPTEPKQPEPKESEGEFDTMSGNTGDIDVDDIMKAYLSDEEYKEYLAKHTAPEVDTPAVPLTEREKEVEDFVSEIESAAEKQPAAEPTTETAKVLAEMDLANIGGDEEIDEVDVNLMIALGMGDELSEKIGDENAQVVEEALKKDARAFSKQKREKEIPDEIDANMEYTDASQIGDVFAIYKKQYRNSILKIIGSLFFIFLIFLYENYTFVVGEFPEILSPLKYPTIHSMVPLQILLIDCLFVIKPILKGLKGIFTFKPVPESILSASLLASVAYHTAVCFMFDGSIIFFCDLPIAALITLTLLVQLFVLRRDIMSFNIVSSRRQKYVISRVADEDATLEHEAFDEYVDEGDAVFRVNKASFVDNFFERTRTPAKANSLIGAIIPVCLLLAAFFLVYSVLINEDWYSGVRRAYYAFVLALPATTMITFSYPLYRAVKVSYGMGSTIVGESSLEEYSDVGSISFDDRDVFPSLKTKVTSINVFGNNRIDRVIYNVASLFRVLGGPLGDVFARATKDFEISDDVEIVDVSDDGIEAVISGKHIFYGKASYLAKNNFTVEYNPQDEKLEMKGETRVAYLVCNDEVAAKLYIHYELDRDFVDIAKRLYNAGLCIGIKSFDPGIDDSLIAKSINLEEYAVKVMKYRYINEKVVVQDRVDSGVVSKKGSKSLLRTLVLCDKVNGAIKGSLILKAISVLVAFGIMAYIVINKYVDYRFLNVWVTLFQAFWAIPTLLIARINIRK